MKQQSYPISEHVADAIAEADRLKDIQKKFEAIGEQRAALDAEAAALAAEVEELTGYPVEIPTGSPAKKRKYTKRTTSNTKAKTKTKTKAKSKSKGKSKGGSETGESREEIMLRVMPTKKDGPIKKDAILALVEKAGFKSNAADPLAGVGQSLNNLRNSGFASNTDGERGEWCLTASGVKERDKNLKAEAAEAKSE